MEAALEIGLIETRKSHFGVHGNEERVEIFGVVVFVFELCDSFSGGGDWSGEIHADGVFAGVYGVAGKFDMAVLDFCGDPDAIDGEVVDRSFAKIEKNGCGGTGMKLKFFVAGCGWRMRREREPEMIANVRKLAGALAGQFAWNAVGRRCGKQIARG